MEVDQLRTFLLAADLQSFTQAARHLSFSQSAISQQIRELEDDLGLKLFERHSRSVSLTPAGEALRPRARQILEEVERAADALSTYRGQLQGTVRIAAGSEPGTYLLPFALARFTERYPGLKGHLALLEPETLVQRIQKGDLDFALIEESRLPSRLHGWEKTPAFESELVLIAPKGHAWLKSGPIQAIQLSEAPLILPPPDHPVRHELHESFEQVGVNARALTVRMEVETIEAIKQAVMAGLGLGFVPAYAIGTELESGKLEIVSLNDFAIRHRIWLIRPTQRRPAMSEKFIEYLLKSNWLPQALNGLAWRSADEGK